MKSDAQYWKHKNIKYTEAENITPELQCRAML